MRINSFVQDDKLLVIRANRAPGFILVSLILITLIAAVIPILSLIYRGISGEGLHLGNFILLFLFGFIDFFLIRITLWNYYGKEVYVLNSKTIEYYPDYNWFKGEKREYSKNLIT